PEALVRLVSAGHAPSDSHDAPGLLNRPGATDEERLAAWSLADMRVPGHAHADIIVAELGTANFDAVDPVTGDFRSADRVFTTTTASQLRILTEARTRGVPVLSVTFGASWSRAFHVHRSAGRLPGRQLALLVHGGEQFPAAHPATPAGLAAHRALLPAEDEVEWMVSAHGADVLELADEVIAAGGHIAIGLGDHPHTGRGRPTNVELVTEVVRIGRQHGRSPAKPDQVRALLAREVAE
ncbi:MAG: 3-keto-5-aminohexanoate cleavage protein, partial [Microbacterium gubbeenense]